MLSLMLSVLSCSSVEDSCERLPQQQQREKQQQQHKVPEDDERDDLVPAAAPSTGMKKTKSQEKRARQRAKKVRAAGAVELAEEPVPCSAVPEPTEEAAAEGQGGDVLAAIGAVAGTASSGKGCGPRLWRATRFMARGSRGKCCGISC